MDKVKPEIDKLSKEIIDEMSKIELPERTINDFDNKSNFISELEKDISFIVKKMNSNSKIINNSKKIMNLYNSVIDEVHPEWSHMNEEFTKYVASGNIENYLQIIDDGQDVAIDLGFVINEIGKIVGKRYAKELNKFNLSIGYGDGDEGCIYLE